MYQKLTPVKAGKLLFLFPFFLLLFAATQPAAAHCDSYDGPVIKDAYKALKAEEVDYVLKWISEEQEAEIKKLFSKTVSLKKGDQEIYQIVEKHFLETLVRLHREGEGAPYTGLKPAGTTTRIIVLTDHALETGYIDELAVKLNTHVEKVLREKYQKVAELSKVRDESPEKGRAYVAAYVDYTHTIEGLHSYLEPRGKAHGH